MITVRGLVLVPGLGNKKAYLSDKITIVRPDGSSIKAAIRGISFNLNRDILVDNHLTKEDVPIGSEVWLNKE